MTYRHSELLTGLVAYLCGYAKIRQVSPVHPTVGGSMVVIEDTTNGAVYRIHFDIIKSEKKVDPLLYANDVIFPRGGSNV